MPSQQGGTKVPPDSTMQLCDAASARALELDRVVGLLQILTCTDLGRSRLELLLPPDEDGLLDSPEADGVELDVAPLEETNHQPASLQQWSSAEERRSLGHSLRRLLADQELVRPLPSNSVLESSGSAGLVQRDGVDDGALSLLRASLQRRGVLLDGEMLVRLADLGTAASGAVRRLQDGAEAEEDEVLAELLDTWCVDAEALAEFAESVHRYLDGSGQVRPEATPRLRALSQRLQTARRKLYREFEGYVEEHRELLAEDTLSARQGRLTVLLGSGNRGRLAGLHHGRSSTGRSYYFEPLQLVETNNEVQEARGEEEAERQRILLELATTARALRPVLLGAIDLWAVLDEQQAIARFARAVDACFLEPTPLDSGLRVFEGRHPLLDPRLRELRRRTLGDAGHDGEIVPLDLDLQAARVVVITGPNAGGKTVALKTVGLLALMQGLGLPVPCNAQSLLPRFRRVIAVIGDEQDLLRDRSTFSARLLRLREVWGSVRKEPATLVLLDEIGSGTNPQEGAALAEPLLDRLVECGTTAVLTTHLVELAARAHELTGAVSAGMEFDAAEQQPRFRVHLGPPAGSQAISLARRLGLPAEWLAAAEDHLSGEYRSLLALLEEVESERNGLRAERRLLETRRVDQETLNRRLEERESALREEAKTLRARLDQRLGELRDEAIQRLEAEVARIEDQQHEKLKRWRQQNQTGNSSSPAKALGVMSAAARRTLVSRVVQPTRAAAQEVLGQPVEEQAAESPPDAVGQWVLHRGLGWRGELVSLSGQRAVVRVGSKKVQCDPQELSRAAPSTPQATTSSGARGQRRGRPVVPVGSRSEASAARDAPGSEVHLIGQRVEPALDLLDRYLDQALLAGHESVRVVHGHGTGRLRDAVRRHLAHHPLALEHRPAEPQHGGNGATFVRLRRSAAS